MNNRNSLNILLVDNYDSFTFNLKHLIEKQDNVNLTLVRNDDDFINDVKDNKYNGVVIGPGPGSPENEEYFGLNKKIILEYGTKGLPILGICLGFQGIYHSFGGRLEVAKLPVHGKVSALQIKQQSALLNDVSEGIKIMRYHSILCNVDDVPDEIIITAIAGEGFSTKDNGIEPMALEHKSHPIYGLQFHPESFASEYGDTYIKNFLSIVASYKD